MSLTFSVRRFGSSFITISLERESNVIKLKEPVVIIGDIHGQFYDMIHMFEKIIDGRKLPE